MELAEWRCARCGTLLGTRCSLGLRLRYKEVEYVVAGKDYSVLAVCRKCARLNETRGKAEVFSEVNSRERID